MALRAADRDWFVAERELVVPIAKVPGLRPLGSGLAARWELHRSVLPLLDDPDARRFLARDQAQDWTARDAALADRGIKLRNAQHVAIDYIDKRRGTLLGDDMRVGKTLSAIMSHDPASGPLIVICPAMVRQVWISWLGKVFPDEPIGVLVGRTFDPAALDHKLVVGHYDILAWWQSFRSIGTIVFDEAHMLTNAKSKRSEAALLLARCAERVICATGTPIWNLPKDLWHVLALIAPAAFGGYYEFCNRYAAPVPTAYGTKYTGVSNEEELTARLSEVMIRRRWIDVQQDLPPISRNVLLVDLDTPTQRKLDIIAAEIASDRASTIGLLSRYRERLSHVKAPYVLAEATKMLDRAEPLVIWTWHVALAEKIAAELGPRGFLLTGEVPAKERDDRIGAWNAHPAAALVCTMAVAQVGLDFSHARLAIFAEIDYTPAILAQAEMRTFTPTRAMNVTYVVANHMIDQRIVMALTKKLDAANPLGVGVANDTISMLRSAVYGTPEEADLDRLLADVLAS
jgi:SWI/SNF-related matrix-associated actin-dependent regulator of chromatin subfamily A-like protein 1